RYESLEIESHNPCNGSYACASRGTDASRAAVDVCAYFAGGVVGAASSGRGGCWLARQSDGGPVWGCYWLCRWGGSVSRGFLSHSSRDSRPAIAVKKCLIEQEPGLAEEIFLD